MVDEMTPRERVMATFRKEETDKIPISFTGVASSIASRLLGREAYVGFGIQGWREANALWLGEQAHQDFLEKSLQDAFELAKAMDQDIVRYKYWTTAPSIRPTKKRDEYTFLYGAPKGEWRLMRYNPTTELCGVIAQHPPKQRLTYENLEKNLTKMEERLRFPCSELIRMFRIERDTVEVRSVMETIGREYAIRVGGGGIGIPHNSALWLRATVRRPDLVSRLLDIQVELAGRRIDALARVGVKLVWGGGDFASNKGPFYSPKVFHELMLPRLQIISKTCHKHGMYYLFASDGNLWPVADDLFGECGVDGYFEIDRRAGMDLSKLREKYPELTLIGSISSHTLSQGTPNDVIAETLSCLKEAKRSGGIIVGCSNMIVGNTPMENFNVMTKTIREYR